MRARVVAAAVVGACLVAACRAPAPMLPVVATPPPTLPSAAEIARACAIEVSCFQSPIASSVTECAAYLTAGLDDWLEPTFLVLGTDPAEFRHYIDCADSGADCATVLDCVSRGHDAGYCAAHPGFSCDGDQLVQCASVDPALFVTDCAALGMHCAERNGAAGCTDGVGCDPNSPAACDGNRYYQYCNSMGLRYRLDCARSSIPNATCRIGSNRAGCLPSGPPCASPRCDGDVRVTCLVGQEVRDDCTQLGSTCTMVAGKPACVPVATTCDSNANGACDGNAISLCLQGVVETVDCSAIGLSTCMRNRGGDGPLCN